MFKRFVFFRPIDPSTQRNESYFLQQLHINNTAIYTDPDYSSVGPSFDTIATSSTNIGTYDVIEHSQKNSNMPQAEPANPTPVSVEASKRRDDFYNAEQHTYASVDVQKKSYRNNLQSHQQQDKASTGKEINTYEAINDGRKTAIPQDKLANPTPVADESSKKGDDFYDAEEHTYSVVNIKHKKRAKKTSEDGEGERQEPPVNDLAMGAGDVSRGVGEEGYSKLKL